LEAIVHFFGGKNSVLQSVPLFRGGELLGEQRFHLIAPDTAFRFSALSEDTGDYEHALCSMVRHSSLRTIQWCNMNHHAITLVTLT
jgi:hypothetical protein